MADDRHADDEEGRQREQEGEDTRNRAGEAGSMQEDPGEQLGDLDEALETHDFPTTTDELIDAYGDYEIETQSGWTSLDEVLDRTDDRTYNSPDAVRSRILRLIHR